MISFMIKNLFADMIMNLLLGQYSSVIANRDKTLENQPLKKLHEKVVSDVVSNIISLSQVSCVCMCLHVCVSCGIKMVAMYIECCVCGNFLYLKASLKKKKPTPSKVLVQI